MLRVTTTSNAMTDGIRVTVTSRYIREQSAPRDRRYVFAYTVQIANEGARPARLVSRHWVITDSTGKIEEVKGPGVVGEQPRIEPGDTFQYTSGCVLTTSRGSMEGTYQMVRDDQGAFDAAIGRFSLELPFDVN